MRLCVGYATRSGGPLPTMELLHLLHVGDSALCGVGVAPETIQASWGDELAILCPRCLTSSAPFLTLRHSEADMS